MRRFVQDDGIFYLLERNPNVCVKIHSYENKVYVDFRKYKVESQTKRILTKWEDQI